MELPKRMWGLGNGQIGCFGATELNPILIQCVLANRYATLANKNE